MKESDYTSATPAAGDEVIFRDIDDPATATGMQKRTPVQTLVEAGAALTTLGDTMYGDASGVPTRLAGNTSTTRKFWRQAGTGSASAAPAWDTLQAGDIPQLASYAPSGLTGAVQPARFAGGTTSGAPASGTFSTGDFIVDQSGRMWICTAGGSPGTWVALVNRTAAETISGLKTFTGNMIIQSGSGNGLVISSDGTATSAGAVYFNPAAGNAGGMNMKNTTDGLIYTIIANILGLPAGQPAIAGYSGGWVFFSAGSGSGSNPIVAFGNSSSTGPGAAGGCALTAWTNSKLETLKNVLDDGSTGASTWASTVNLPAGTTSAAPLKHQSGSLLTTPAAGAREFDGTAFYATSVAGARQVEVTSQFQNLSGSRTFAANTSAQALFNATANGAITLAGSTTYEFEAEFDITGLSGSTHTVSFTLGGTATYTSLKYVADVLSPFTAGTFAAWPSAIFTSASAQTFQASGTNTSMAVRLRGTLRVNAGGTLIPQITQGTNGAAAVVSANSCFRVWPIGSNTVTNVGNWS
jgi:hypothetical protein